MSKLFIVMHNKQFMLVALLAALSLFLAEDIQAEDLYAFGPENSIIEGSIRYTVLGKYHVRFEEFEGVVKYDNESQGIVSVMLNIDARSVKSRFESLDNFVRSEKILDVEKFPSIIFRSSSIDRNSESYKVKGVLQIRGEQKPFMFPFQADASRSSEHAPQILTAEGTWIIDRKDFGIVWNKYLDKGGVLVGDHITIDWELNAVQRR